MVAADRKMRSKRQATFLEDVKDLLDRLCHDMSEIKFRLDALQNLAKEDTCLGSLITYADSGTRESLALLRPPPPPPLLDIYDRNYLLRARCHFKDDALLERTKLPRAYDIGTLSVCIQHEFDDVTAFSLEQGHYSTNDELSKASSNTVTMEYDSLLASCYQDKAADVDWNSLHFNLEEDELEDEFTLGNIRISDQLLQSHVSDSMGWDMNMNAFADRQEPNYKNIAMAQQTAYLRQKSTRLIQTIWRSFKKKLKGKTHEEPNHILRSPGGVEVASVGRPCVRLEVGANSNPAGFDELWQKERDSERQANNLWSLGEANRLELANTEPDIDGKLKCFLDLINEFSGQIPSEGQTAFIFNAFRGLAERKNLDESEYFAMLERLETYLGTRMEVSLPFVCIDCSWRHEKQEPQCHRCAGTDIYDERRCACNHLGICNIGSCCASESDEDYSDNST